MANMEDALPPHGGQLRRIAELFGVPQAKLLDFSANINPEGPPSSVLSTLRASLDDLSTLVAYPDLLETELKQAVARYAGSQHEHVMVANGFVPLLEATLRALSIRTCLVPVPAFVEYRRTLERMGIGFVPLALHPDSCFSYAPTAMMTGQHDAVLLANPQNPSGVSHDAAAMCDLVERALDKKVYVLLDEAFIDYVPDDSLSAMVDQYPNLVVFRSLTKFYGMPGLRVAYSLANPSLSRMISDHLAPWPVTTLASRAAIAALGDQAYALHARSENYVRRVALQAALEACGVMTFPASANFVLFRLSPSIDADLFWRRMISEHQIVLRSCANYDSLATGHFRAAVRTQSENNRLAEALLYELRQGRL